MASAHSYRSPSPPPSKHTDRRNTNSENASSLRRSFSSGSNPRPSILKNVRRFDPVTPANSPSDFSVRRSMSKESTVLSSSKDCEEKENDAKDHNIKACKQSQVKGSKNFMSPTISASSKFSPSPRKKALVERNDPVRTSMSLSNGKAVFFSTLSRSICDDSELKSEMTTLHNEETEGSLGVNVADPEKCKLVREDPPLPKPVKRVTFSDVPLDPKYDRESFSESVVADPDHFHVESSAKDKIVSLSESGITKEHARHSSVLSSIAPLDADPLCLPYDPVNNYLSPRPRFLHYKPNPRTEILSNIKSGLEDSLIGELMSENLSESESTEESQREDSSPNRESRVAASADLVLGAVETEDDILLVNETYESLPVNSAALPDDIISEENCIQKPEKKPWTLSKYFFFFSMLLMVIIAGVSISFIDPKALNGNVPKALSFSDSFRSEFVASAKEKFDWLTNNINQFSIYSVSFATKLMNELCGSEKLGPLQYTNFTDFRKSPWVGNNFLGNIEVRKESEEIYNKHELEDDCMEMNVDGFEEEASSDVDDIFVNEFQTPDAIPEMDEMSQEDAENVEFQSKISQSVEDEASYVEGVGSDDILEDEFKTLDEIPETDKMLHEIQEQVLALSDMEQLREVNSWDELHATTAIDEESVFSGDIIEVPLAKINIENVLDDITNDDCSDCSNGNELMDLNYSTEDIRTSANMDTTPLANNAIAISSLFAAILAVAALLIRLRRSPTSSNVAAETNRPLLSSNITHADQENTVSHNWETEVESMNNSEMSGLQQKTVSFSSTKREEMSRSTSEVQGLESKANMSSSRRESLASSSSEFSMAPSYGSFTSYEKAAGEEKFLTPVRRSSRIRNRHQVTSS